MLINADRVAKIGNPDFMRRISEVGHARGCEVFSKRLAIDYLVIHRALKVLDISRPD